MNDQEFKNRIKVKDNKAGRKTASPITPQSPEELLNTLADIVIERIFEENKIRKLSIKL